MHSDVPDSTPSIRRRDVLSLAAGALTTTLAGCSSLQQKLREQQLSTPERRIPADWQPNPGEWPMGGYNYARTSHNPFATPPRENPETAWMFDEVTDSISSLVVGDDTVFLKTRSELVALAADSGREQWRTQRDPRGGLQFIEGRLYDWAPDRLTAMMADGTELWTASLEGFFWYSILERDGRIYLLYRDKFATLHADTGEGIVNTRPDEADYYFPATAGGSVYAGQFSLSAYEIQGAQDGNLPMRWDTENSPYESYGFPAIDAGLVFRPEFAHPSGDVKMGRLSVLDTSTGNRRNAVSFETVPHSPAVANGSTFVSTTTVHAGEIGNDGKLVALTYEGDVRWEYTPEASLQPPVVANNAVYTAPFANRDAPLIAFDAASGEELWQKEPTSAELRDSPEFAIAGDTLYVADGTRIRALRA
ncbi:outer membrane protein assembly factor BamB family protein [Haladaptatus sp. CMSO5]|uniref:outer membrane protein assembly factor BamB family protein n=1 Tax=Haladaptatus sp. CMSO5 TaxID=3120514 RepID=UPI002FCE3C1A